MQPRPGYFLVFEAQIVTPTGQKFDVQFVNMTVSERSCVLFAFLFYKAINDLRKLQHLKFKFTQYSNEGYTYFTVFLHLYRVLIPIIRFI